MKPCYCTDKPKSTRQIINEAFDKAKEHRLEYELDRKYPNRRRCPFENKVRCTS